MKTALLARLLLFVSLPMVSWSSRLTFDLVPETGNPDPGVLAAFQAAAAGPTVNSPLLTDAIIDLNNSYAWDLNRDDSITPGTYDFGGVATQEIGNALGFLSRVDELDRYSVPKNGLLPYASTAYLIKMLDLFRYSDLSTSAGALDFTADSRSKFLSVDRGATYIAQFANGKDFGDARQASHWKDGSGLGIMNPSAQAVQWLRISHNDIAALDAIGWNTQEPAPGPERLALCLIGLLAMVPSMLRRRGEIGERRTGRRRRFHPRGHPGIT
jgi:hypothetical protein